MHTKLRTACEKFCKTFDEKKWGLLVILWGINLCGLALFVTITQQWDRVFYYPEEEFQQMENQVYGIIESQEFLIEHNHYKLRYSGSSNKLTIIIFGEYGATLMAEINNYMKDNQTIKIERNNKGGMVNNMVSILSFLLLTFFLAVLIIIVLLILRILLWIEELFKRKNKQNNKTAKK